ncbi:MAG: FliM/FliN family flagellar motor switch protein [Pseudomonadota bacterium]
MASDDVLTEGEIDALMESVDDGEDSADASDDGKYRRFDFGAREHSLLREFTAFESVLERQADLLGAQLDAAFSIEFIVRSLPPSLLTVSDALATLGRAVGVTTSALVPLPGPVFAIASSELLSFVVNAYFGGSSSGEAEEGGEKNSLTPSELRVAERLSEIQFRALCEAWADKVALEPGEEPATLGVPDRLEMVPRGDLLLRLAFHLHAGDHESELIMLMPFMDLEPYRERFAPPKQKNVDPTDSWEPFFRRELPVIELEVAGVLSTKSMSLSEVLTLAKGSVVPLAPPEQVRLLVDEVTLAEGRYGSFEGNKAVQIQRLSGLLRPPSA